ncbi:transporter substrate-binding domain-containing protein [Roseibium aggregatum]|uniref:transporter substrate-binding domain-containing protein n=1 Tax=Roseibium aggregatum TaxID=187304 RepID=UPI001AD94E2A|nr:transporter substrate-binding domain-containing protein [Roseibium aggregatum]
MVPNFWDPKAVHDRPADIPGKIQFLATDGYPPFVYRDAEDRLTGFNVDLARAICQELDTSCSLRIKEFSGLLPALEEGEGDAIISGLARTDDLVERLSFSDDYLKLPARFIVRTGKEKAFGADAIAGARISVEAGSRHEAFAARFWPEAFLMPFDTVEAARTALVKGDVDAHFGDGLSLSFWLNSTDAADCCRFAGGPWLEPGYFDEGLSIAMRKDDASTREAINYALRRLQQTGVYRELYLRYFPVSFF